jgi:hypothetical protein
MRIKNLLLIIAPLFVIYILFYTGFVYKFLVPVHLTPYGEAYLSTNLFRDWIITFREIECYKFSIGCIGGEGVFPYGPIMFYVPFSGETYSLFYYKILPPILVVIFIFFIFKLIKPKNTKNYLFFLLIIFTPSTMLAIERMNIDLPILLIAVLICLSRYSWLNFLLISFCFLTKYYPATFFVNFFIEKEYRSKIKSIILCILCLIFSFSFLFFRYDIIVQAAEVMGESQAGYHLLFSVKGISKFFKYIFNFNYIFLLVITYLSFIFLTKKFYEILKKKNIFKILDIYKFEDKLFIIGINTLIINYLIFSNYYYREIFLILGLPLLLKLKPLDNSLINFMIRFIIIRYVFLFLYNFIILGDTFFYIDGVRTFYNSFISIFAIKNILDFILMSFLSSFLFFYNSSIIKKTLGFSFIKK